MVPMPTNETEDTASTTTADPKSACGNATPSDRATTPNRKTVRSDAIATANAPMPSRCAGREMGAMNVYSMVPSQRSQATVSVTISKSRPRYDQTTAPIRRTMVSSLMCAGTPCCSTPLAMKTMVSVFATV